MDVTIKLFASLAETHGWREKRCQLPAGATVRDAWVAATGREGMPPRVLCAVNLEYSDVASVLQGGEEVGFFPPVTGG